MALNSTERRIDLDAVMRRWVQAGATFSDETLGSYSTAARGRLRFHRCARCGFGQFRPVVVGDSGFYGAISQDKYYNREKWEFKRALTQVRARNARSVLDVGCGSGFFLDKVKEIDLAIAVAGIEINDDAAALARARGLEVYVRNFAFEPITGIAAAEIVTAFHVLEHVRKPDAFLVSLRQLVRADGLVLIAVPDADGLISKFPDALTELPPHHVTYWNETSLRSAMSHAGLELLRVEREPLSDILWDGYFPELWADKAWPAHFGRVAARLAGQPGEGMAWVARVLANAGMSNLHGVGGHSLLAMAQPVALTPRRRRSVHVK